MEEHETQIGERIYGLIIAIFALGLLTVGFALGWTYGTYQGRNNATVKTDTVWRNRIIKMQEPATVQDSLLGWDMVTIPREHIGMSKEAMEELIRYGKTPSASYRQVSIPSIYTDFAPDTNVASKLKEADTTTVEIPMPTTQRKYEDSLYTAWVSGLRWKQWPKLDSIHIRQRTEIITRTVMQSGRRKPWSIGIGVGYGYTGKNFQPFLGATLQYKIMEF